MSGTGSPVAKVDETVLFGRPRLWIALLALIILIAGLLAWGTLNRGPLTVPVTGLITTTGGNSDIGSALTGTVKELYVDVGDRVDTGNNVVAIENDLGEVVQVQASIPGRVLEIATRVGDFVEAGQSLMILQNTDEPLRAIAFVPVNDAGEIAVGQEVLVSPSSAPASEYGYIEGTVEYVGSVPMSPARLEQLTSGVAGIDMSGQTSPVVEARILLLSGDTPSGFTWTIGSGPPYALLAETPFSGQIILGTSAPLSRLFG